MTVFANVVFTPISKLFKLMGT